MRFRFSLRLLLVLVTIVAVMLGAGAQFVFRIQREARRHRAACERLESFGYSVQKESKNPTEQDSHWLVAFSRKWIDAEAYPSDVQVYLGNELLTTQEARERLAIVSELSSIASLTICPDVLDAEYVELLGQFKSLGDLTIAARQVEASAGPRIVELGKLSKLTVDEAIGDEVLVGIAKLPNLEQLTLDIGELTTRATGGARGFPKLRWLTLLGEVRDPGPLGAILRTESLEVLDLSMCKVSANALVAIENAQSISKLSVGGDDGNESLFQHVALLKRLQVLNTYGLRVSQFQQVGELAACERLAELTLTETKLAEADFLRLKPLTQLRLLHMEGDLDSAAAEAFLRDAPSCQIRAYTAEDKWKVFRIVDGKMECSERSPGF